jgi:hypothetical protein
MSTFEEVRTCSICGGAGTAVCLRIGPQSSRRQSMNCSKGCWASGSPGSEILNAMAVAPVAER